jgi:hypothetical protein
MILSIDKNIIQLDIKLERKFNGYRPKYTHFQSFYEDNIIIEVFNENQL